MLNKVGNLSFGSVILKPMGKRAEADQITDFLKDKGADIVKYQAKEPNGDYTIINAPATLNSIENKDVFDKQVAHHLSKMGFIVEIKNDDKPPVKPVLDELGAALDKLLGKS